MKATIQTERAAAIERIRERIEGLEAEIARCGTFRAGTAWFADRVNELAGMRAALVRLSAK